LYVVREKCDIDRTEDIGNGREVVSNITTRVGGGSKVCSTEQATLGAGKTT